MVLAPLILAAELAKPVEPIGAILDAFKTHPVVALSAGEGHGDLRGPEFVVSLIKDARFAPLPIDVVVENANARYQSTSDRYTRGDDVPYGELRRIWDDTTQPEVFHRPDEIPEIYRAVREINRGLPPQRRHRVLLGDPPIDWDAVHDRADVRKWMEQRDSNPAEVVRREALAKRRKALLVYGGGHLQRKQQATNYVMDSPLAQTIVSLLERAGVTPFVIETIGERDAVRSWPAPSLAVLRGTRLGAEDVPPLGLPRVTVQADGSFVPIPKEKWIAMPMQEQFDAVLYLGPKSTLRERQLSAEVCSDREYIETHLQRMALAALPPFELDRVRALCGLTK
ncbi:MAG TPA: hypothetical protein VFA59_02525 [Vicinamibacterales bacterium]|nr:hypothetical protein [Vicinamibacterales bacterium]